MAELRRVPFSVPLRVAVGDVTERSGELIEGPAGWGEFSPLPSWDAEQVALAEAAAIEAATQPFPEPVRASVLVNFMVPRVAPDEAARMALASGCATIKVKVGDPDGEARVRAVREAMPGAAIRVDANGSWDIVTAGIALSRLDRYGIEFAEDPVASMEDLAQLRKGSSVLLAAEACVRTIADARRLRAMRAADVLVLKPQRIGGSRAALDAAAEAGLPTVASSALETSVGLAMVVAVAAALPDAPFAHGVGTAALLARDVVAEPLVPVDGRIVPRRMEPAA